MKEKTEDRQASGMSMFGKHDLLTQKRKL